jgi:D-glycero-beta-D-manno-heptose 1-phosphate adenylyltransferase
MTWHRRQKHLAWDDLLSVRSQARDAGLVVVWTNGTFDLLHPGHVDSLESARSLGDMLIVGLNSDSSVKSYKGPNRPIMFQQERVAMVAALECVDYVTIFEESTPERVLSQLQPDIHCKGAEYAPPHGREIPERAIVEAYGGRLEFLPLVRGLSTTDLIQRIRERA